MVAKDGIGLAAPALSRTAIDRTKVRNDRRPCSMRCTWTHSRTCRTDRSNVPSLETNAALSPHSFDAMVAPNPAIRRAIRRLATPAGQRCENCPRSPSGRIKRSGTARRAFMREHPCPATGSIDHVNPLECGGPDVPANMQWQTKEEAKAKDRGEGTSEPPPSQG
jgi:hypothetical protein